MCVGVGVCVHMQYKYCTHTGCTILYIYITLLGLILIHCKVLMMVGLFMGLCVLYNFTPYEEIIHLFLLPYRHCQTVRSQWAMHHRSCSAATEET